MPAINFRAEFAEKVERGYKRQTIRPPRKRPIKVGDKLILYTGMRTGKCRKLGVGRCTEIFPVSIWSDACNVRGEQNSFVEIRDIAHRDGFPTVKAFLDWFLRVHGLPFSGVVIRWELEKE